MNLNFLKLTGDISKKNLIYIVGAIGILLVFLSSAIDNDKPEVIVNNDFDYCEMIEDKLENILPQIESVGKVKVMITAKNYGRITLAKDKGSDGEKTIILNQKGGGEDAKIIEESYPVIQGVVVAADGGKSDRVKMDITEAITALLGVEAHKIKVYERKIR